MAGMRGQPSILPLRLYDVGFDTAGRILLDGISLTLADTGRTVVLGHNGAGKSLLLRLCHGLIAPTRGRIEWQGPGGSQAGPQARSQTQRRQAMVFQRPVMLRRSAHANLVHALGIAGFNAAARRERACRALERFGLTALADQPARTLSGGEQQRLALARAWALDPEVLFLDEPTSALDPAAARMVEDMIHSFSADGIKVILTTHDLGQARRLADEIIFLHRGRLMEHRPADAFFHTPETAEAAGFLRGELVW